MGFIADCDRPPGIPRDSVCWSCLGPCNEDNASCNGCWSRFEGQDEAAAEDSPDLPDIPFWHDWGPRCSKPEDVKVDQAWAFEPAQGEHSIWIVKAVEDGVVTMARVCPQPASTGEWFARAMVEDAAAGWTFLRHPYDDEAKAALAPPAAPAPAVDSTKPPRVDRVDVAGRVYTIDGKRYVKGTGEEPWVKANPNGSPPGEALDGQLCVSRSTVEGWSLGIVLRLSVQNSRVVATAADGTTRTHGTWMQAIADLLVPEEEAMGSALQWKVGQARIGPILAVHDRASSNYGVGQVICSKGAHQRYTLTRPAATASGYDWIAESGFGVCEDWPSLLEGEEPPDWIAGQLYSVAFPPGFKHDPGLSGSVRFVRPCIDGPTTCGFVLSNDRKHDGSHVELTKALPRVLVTK